MERQCLLLLGASVPESPDAERPAAAAAVVLAKVGAVKVRPNLFSLVGSVYVVLAVLHVLLYSRLGAPSRRRRRADGEDGSG